MDVSNTISAMDLVLKTIKLVRKAYPDEQSHAEMARYVLAAWKEKHEKLDGQLARALKARKDGVVTTEKLAKARELRGNLAFVDECEPILEAMLAILEEQASAKPRLRTAEAAPQQELAIAA